MIFTVELTESAIADLDDIVHWIAGNDSPQKALSVLGHIQAKVGSLSQHPERGSVPFELKSVGMDRYREVFFKPYRIIYHIRQQRVIINVIADGRRDMVALLQRRLLKG